MSSTKSTVLNTRKETGNDDFVDHRPAEQRTVGYLRVSTEKIERRDNRQFLTCDLTEKIVMRKRGRYEMIISKSYRIKEWICWDDE